MQIARQLCNVTWCNFISRCNFVSFCCCVSYDSCDPRSYLNVNRFYLAFKQILYRISAWKPRVIFWDRDFYPQVSSFPSATRRVFWYSAFLFECLFTGCSLTFRASMFLVDSAAKWWDTRCTKPERPRELTFAHLCVSHKHVYQKHTNFICWK
jgi:hypothetical protein